MAPGWYGSFLKFWMPGSTQSKRRTESRTEAWKYRPEGPGHFNHGDNGGKSGGIKAWKYRPEGPGAI